ncbi:MAG: hypothetical protein ACYC35_27530 [Pirellulales bacterium]
MGMLSPFGSVFSRNVSAAVRVRIPSHFLRQVLDELVTLTLVSLAFRVIEDEVYSALPSSPVKNAQHQVIRVEYQLRAVFVEKDRCVVTL